MSKKVLLFIPLILILGLIYGCSNDNENIFPTAIPLENSIKEIIISKGENYDFLGDELFNKKVDEFAVTILKEKSTTAKNYAIGNLDEDNIPELVVFIGRNPDNIKDQGGLGVYKFSGEKYELLDRVDMNYDNINYLLKVGKISNTQNGILLSNQVGAHSAVTYGFILQDGKLKSILNDKKISLISTYTSNEIRDIDDDGILEFSIYTIDPETEEQSSVGSDKMILWYKWDEKDSGNLIKVAKVPITETKKVQADENGIELLKIDKAVFINYLKNNKDKYDKYMLSQIIENHLKDLNLEILDRSIEIGDLFNKYQKNNNFDYLFDKYELSIDRLNDIEYLKREKILQSEIDLKEYLIKHVEMGYKLDSSEGIYYYKIDYQKFINIFGDSITNQFRDYLNIKAMDSNEPFLRDAALVITRDKLAERIVELEHFKLTYPYSEHLDEISALYESYVLVFIFGSDNTPNYDHATNTFNEESIAVFQNTINKYPHTYFSDVIQELTTSLNLNLGILDDDIREKINKLLN